MLAFFQSPLIIEFAATTPVIQGIFTFDINLSYLAYIRTILANEGSKFVSLVPQVKPFEPGLFPRPFFHRNNGRTKGDKMLVRRRSNIERCEGLQAPKHRSAIGGDSTLE